jgi:hypothetical protein
LTIDNEGGFFRKGHEKINYLKRFAFFAYAKLSLHCALDLIQINCFFRAQKGRVAPFAKKATLTVHCALLTVNYF